MYWYGGNMVWRALKCCVSNTCKPKNFCTKNYRCISWLGHVSFLNAVISCVPVVQWLWFKSSVMLDVGCIFFGKKLSWNRCWMYSQITNDNLHRTCRNWRPHREQDVAVHCLVRAFNCPFHFESAYIRACCKPGRVALPGQACCGATVYSHSQLPNSECSTVFISQQAGMICH